MTLSRQQRLFKMVRRTNQNLILVSKFKKNIQKLIKLNKIIFFGSRAKGTFNENSDFDLIIVSPDFKGIPWYKRSLRFYLLWNEIYPVEILCYTPDEIKERANKINIISQALKEGIEI